LLVAIVFTRKRFGRGYFSGFVEFYLQVHGVIATARGFFLELGVNISMHSMLVIVENEGFGICPCSQNIHLRKAGVKKAEGKK
jgi:hypothetical protein